MDVFTLAAKLTLDSSEFEKGLNSSETAFSKLGGSIKKIAATLAVGAVIKKTTDSIVNLTKKSVQAYGQYQQLVGGVETLFKKSAKAVQGYADQAYKTAGISANQYMETVTSFSASLLQGLNGDTEKAAKIANQAIIDMSDNANKMGTSMEAIQNAYQGFAKQNYTMLDNLKLGYGGTKTEMERLLADAEKLSGIKYDINNFSDIIEAIHAIQTELGITGTTAAEAEATIQGSFSAVQAAWENLIVEFGKGNADIAGKTEILVDTLETAFKNVMPVVENALHGIGEFITDIAPIIEEKLPGLIEEVLPGFIDGTEAIIKGIAAALPSIWGAIVEIGGTLMDTISVELHKKSGLLGDVFDSLVTAANDAITTAGGILTVLEDIFGYNDKTASVQASFGMSDAPLLEQVAGYLDQVFFYHNKDAVFGAKFNDQATGPIKEFLTWIGWVDPSAPEEPAPILLYDLSSKFTDNSTKEINEAIEAMKLLDWYNNYEVSTSSVHENKTSDPVADAVRSIYEIMDWDGDGTVTKSEHDDEASGPIRELIEELGTLFTYNEDGTITWSEHQDKSSDVISDVLAKLGVLLEESKKNYDSSSTFEDGTSKGAEEATQALKDLENEGKTPKTSSAKFNDNNSASKIDNVVKQLSLLVEYDNWRVETASKHSDGTSAGAIYAKNALEGLFGFVDKNGDGVVTESEHTDSTSEAAWKAYNALNDLFGIDQEGKLTYSEHNAEEALAIIKEVMDALDGLDIAGEEPYESESTFEDGTTEGAESATQSLKDLSKYKGNVSSTESSFKDGTTSLAQPVFDLVTALKNGPQGLISDTTSRHTVENIVRNIVEGATGQTEAQQQYNQILDAGNGTPTGNALNNIVEAAGSLWNGIVDGVTNLFKPVETHSGRGGKFASAMSGGKILRGATVFGFDDNGPMIGGEAGPEAVVGVGSLNQQIREAVRDGLSGIVAGIAGALNGNNQQPIYVVLDTGELVGAIGPRMDEELGGYGDWKGGGRA